MSLNDDLVEGGLSELGRSLDGVRHVFVTLCVNSCQLEDVSILGDYPHLVNVDLRENRLADVQVLGKLQNMRQLQVAGNVLTNFLDFGNHVDPKTNTLSLPRALEAVDYSENCLTSLGFDLEHHVYLKEVSVADNQIKALNGLYKLPNLRIFDASYNQIQDVSTINNSKLTKLFLGNNQISSLEYIKYLPSLRYFDLSNNKIASLTGLERQFLLTAICLANNVVVDIEEVRKLALLRHLTDLDLSGNPVQNTPNYRQRVLFILPKLTQLDGKAVTAEEVLTASHVHQTDVPTRQAIMLHYLPFLDATTPDNVNSKQLNNIHQASTKGLHDVDEKETELKLGETTIDMTHAQLKHKVARAPRVVNDSGQVSEQAYWALLVHRSFLHHWEGMLPLVRANGLTSLDLSNVALGDVGIWALARTLEDTAVTIRTLNLSGTMRADRWSSELSKQHGLRALIKALCRPHVQVTELSLARCQLDQEEAILLAEFASTSQILATLDVSCNSIGANVLQRLDNQDILVQKCPGLAALMEGISQSSSITSLNLSQNNIDEGGAQVVADALRHPDFPVQELILDGNPLGDVGGSEIARALRSNSRVHTLQIRGGKDKKVQLSTTVIVALAKALAKYNDTVTDLDVSNNNVGDDGASALATALDRDLRYRDSSAVLTQLKMANSGVSALGLTSLARALRKNATLVKLDLSGNTLPSDDSVADLLGSLVQHPALAFCHLNGLQLGSHGSVALGEVLMQNPVLVDVTIGPVNQVASEPIDEEKLAGFRDDPTAASPFNLDGSINQLHYEGDIASIGAALEEISPDTRLQTLGLRGLAGPHLATVARGIGQGVAVETLDLGGSDWSEAAWQALCETVSTSSTLKTLVLSNSSISFKVYGAIRSLFQAIVMGGSLTSLDLSGMELANQGSLALAEGLEDNKSMTHLNLRGCSLGFGDHSEDSDDDEDEDRIVGLTLLLEALAQDTILTSLNLSLNFFSESFLFGLASCLQKNTSLKTLDIRENDLEYTTSLCNAFSLLVGSSQTLETIKLPQIHLGDELSVHQYEEGECIFCQEPEQHSNYVPVQSDNNMDANDYCPATLGLPHEFDRNRQCITCGQLQGVHPFKRDDSVADLNVDLGDTGVDGICPSTIGGKHVFVDGACEGCGLDAPPFTAKIDAQNVSAIPQSFEVETPRTETCPATMGGLGVHTFEDGICSGCGANVDAVADASASNSYANLEVNVQLEEDATADDVTLMEEDNEARYCPATMGNAHEFGDNDTCNLCGYISGARPVDVFAPPSGETYERPKRRAVRSSGERKEESQNDSKGDFPLSPNTVMRFGKGVSLTQTNEMDLLVLESPRPDDDDDENVDPLLTKAPSAAETPREESKGDSKEQNLFYLDNAESDGGCRAKNGLPHDFDAVTGCCIHCGSEQGSVQAESDYWAGSSVDDGNNTRSQLCPATLVDEITLRQRKDNLTTHLAFGLSKSATVNVLDFKFGSDHKLTWQQKQLILSALNKGRNRKLAQLSSNDEPFGLEYLIEESDTGKRLHSANMLGVRGYSDSEVQAKEKADEIENALAAKVAQYRIQLQSNIQ